MADRYFADEPISGDRLILRGDEAHHLIHVMRVSRGAPVTVFDGSGAEFSTVVEGIGRTEVEMAVTARQEIDRELPFELCLAVALPKGDRQKWLVEKAVELGVARLVPLQTRRAVPQLGEQGFRRLRRTVVEASKQCGRNRLMVIDRTEAWSELVLDTAGEPCRLLAHPGGGESGARRVEGGTGWDPRSAPRPLVGEWPGVRAARVFAAIGPEGGFTDEEVASALAAGWQVVDLGPRILRIETAAIFLAARIVAQHVAR
jgi:16S rRNA (uracil1498-N3)-methyltransferase